jgi:RsiW-degrading membrane proteinase PrsW (M82 family)
MSTLLLPPSSKPPVLFLPLLKQVSRKWYVLAPLLALAGGCFGIFGAFITEILHASLFSAYVVAPIIEEGLKPSGVYLMAAKWPRVLRNQLYTALLAALGGACFALVENLVYLNIYIKDPSSQIVIWRYTVGLAVHTVCSFIFGWGINRKLIASINGETKFLSYGKRFFITAVVLHAVYNITVTILALSFKWLK